MKNNLYAVFLNGKYWDAFPSKANAVRESKVLKESFPNVKITVRKVTAL